MIAASAAPLLLPLAAAAATEMPALSIPSAMPGAALPHDVEIKAFASTMAIARIVRETCPGLESDERYLEALRQRLHIVEADHPAFAPEAHAAAKVLKRGLAEAQSREAWCAAVFRLYGPAGTLTRGMLRR